MERKTGEIFEYNGEWYQCVEGLYCDNCAFVNDNCEDRERITLREKLTKQPTTGFCNSEKRNDRKSVIFKKLEKVGKLIEYNGSFYQGYRAIDTAIDVCKLCVFSEISCGEAIICDKGVFYVGIKQNKEDMEEKELNLKEFNLEAAKSGKSVCTRDRRKARIVCFDAKGDQPIIALVEAKGNKDALIEKVERYFINGHSVFEVRETNNDLMMLPKKKEGWVKIRKDINLYDTKEEADRKMIGNDEYVTAKVCWDE